MNPTSSQQSTALKCSCCGMKFQWHRPVPHIRHLFIIPSSHAMSQNRPLLLPYPSAPRTESELRRSLQKSTSTYHSARTGTSAEGLLQLSSGAGAENKVGRFHPVSQHIWQESVKRMKRETFCLWLFGPVGTVSISKSFILLKLPVATGNQIVWQMTTK